MKVDSLDELQSAFAEWLQSKKHLGHPTPEALLARARRATKRHGVKAVVRVTRVERARLFRSPPTEKKGHAATRRQRRTTPDTVPAFSRLELSRPSTAGSRPIVEVETKTGVTLRVFEETPELLLLLSGVCGLGGTR